MATLFIEAGSAATQDLTVSTGGFYGATIVGAGSTVTSDAQAIFGSVRSIKCTSAATTEAAVRIAGIGVDAGTRLSIGFRTTALPVTNPDFIIVSDDNTATVEAWFIGITTAGKLAIYDTNATLVATGTTVLSINTDYYIGLTTQWTSSSVNSLTVYLNGVSEVSASNNANFLSTAGAHRYIGRNFGTAGAGANIGAGTNYIAHVFMDNGSSGNPGKVKVTCKLPASDGSLVQWGASQVTHVNQRPLSTASIVSVTPTTKQTQEYTVDARNAGDVDITNTTIIDYVGWVYAELASTANSPVDHIIVNNVATAITLTTSYAMYTHFAGSASYPGGNTDIGIDAQYTTTGHLVSCAEMGLMFAYTDNAVAVPPPLLDGGMVL